MTVMAVDGRPIGLPDDDSYIRRGYRVLLRWTSWDRAIRFYNCVNLATNCPNWTLEETAAGGAAVTVGP
jgi:hypothetical protein